MKRRKLYSSRRVKIEVQTYIPEERDSKQKVADIFVFASPGLLRVKALIEKYQLIC